MYVLKVERPNLGTHLVSKLVATKPESEGENGKFPQNDSRSCLSSFIVLLAYGGEADECSCIFDIIGIVQWMNIPPGYNNNNNGVNQTVFSVDAIITVMASPRSGAASPHTCVGSDRYLFERLQ